MIGHLQGRLILKGLTSSIIDCHGVGYEVVHTPRTSEALRSETASLFIHTHVREDGIQLFAFISEQERSLFRELTRVTGIGPKLALAVLTALAPNEIASAIQTKDIARLQGIPGVGKKTAERICLDLADRFKSIMVTSESRPQSHELESILLNLGYQKSDIQRVIQKTQAAQTGLALEELVKLSLKELSTQRSLQ